MDNLTECPKCHSYSLEYCGFIRTNVKHYRCLKRDCNHQEFIQLPSIEERLEELTKRVRKLEGK